MRLNSVNLFDISGSADRRITSKLILAVTALWLVGTANAYAETAAAITGKRFVQDRFAIGFWVDPPGDGKMEQRYKEIADANFTMVVGGFGATTADKIRQQLDLCKRFGLRALVSVPGNKYGNLAPDHPGLWGYRWADEPSAGAFPSLASDVEEIRSRRPGKLTFINLLPNYASPAQLGTATYDEHVRRFVDEVKPDVLCMDHYPTFRRGEKDGRDSYCECLSALRRHALRAKIPFWNFFNTMPFGPHTDPTESQLRWQIYASLAHGAKGVLWFCYYTPGGGEFPKGGAIIGTNDKPTRHYAQAQRLNGELKALGPTIMKLTTTNVTRIRPKEETSAALSGSAIAKIIGDPEPNFLIGDFRHEDGRRAVMLQNFDFAYTSWPTVEFDATLESVREIDKQTGKERPVEDSSPAMAGLQMSLDAGEGRLFLLPAH